MNLPFLPTFFNKIDIFQQLEEFEKEKKIKRLWDGVKAVLLWSASIGHQHLGSAIGSRHVIDSLNSAVSEGYLSQEDKIRMDGSSKHILESLPNYGFGEFVGTADPRNPSVRISRNGILAGKILKETNGLKNKWKYEVWIVLWWILLGIAGLILISQVISALHNIFPQETTIYKTHFLNNTYYRKL